MTAQSPPAKRRGRPSSRGQDIDEATLKARRERNREAQNIFRRRRQAAEAAQAKRVRRLEEVVEEMSSIFMSFVDEMLETEAVVKGQPDLVVSLRRSMARILALANEVVGPEEECEGALMSALPTRERVEKEKRATSPLGESTTASSYSPDSNDDTTTTSDSSTSSALCITVKTPNITIPQQPPLFSRSSPPPQPFTIPNVHFDLPPQIFGNGWLGTTPATASRAMDFVPSPSSPLSQDSFTYRLAKASLTIAYLFLSNDPHIRAVSPPEARLFSNPLRGRARDEMLNRLRWLIGPGKSEMYRVVDLPYGRYGQHVYSRNELNPQTVEDVGWPWPSQPAGSPINHLTRFFSIIGVEKQLLALGARVIDSETLELNMVTPPISSITGPDERQPDSWSFVNCFSFPPQPKPGPGAVKVQLSAAQLVASLATRAVCLMRGPGFPRNEIGTAIEEAVIKTGWSISE
ncbi:hypothetical protein FDECE_530 [Fusarium decemcellulare]|nr:hypothetical protein FDECE_530 [Fusarium decemcellulare]